MQWRLDIVEKLVELQQCINAQRKMDRLVAYLVCCMIVSEHFYTFELLPSWVIMATKSGDLNSLRRVLCPVHWNTYILASYHNNVSTIQEKLVLNLAWLDIELNNMKMQTQQNMDWTLMRVRVWDTKRRYQRGNMKGRGSAMQCNRHHHHIFLDVWSYHYNPSPTLLITWILLFGL